MGRIIGNSNPLNQNPNQQQLHDEFQHQHIVDDFEAPPQPPQNPLPSWAPPPPQPAAAGVQYQNQMPVRYPPPMCYHNHQGSLGINNVMMYQYPINVGFENWKTGLFDCMDHPSNAVMTLFCPCVTFGQIAEIVDQGHKVCGTSGTLYCLVTFCSGLPCLISNPYRSKLRSQYRLVESPASDSIVHLCCDLCALCQEYRELQLRGIDPSIGWLGNKAKIQSITQQYAMTPPGSQTMKC